MDVRVEVSTIFLLATEHQGLPASREQTGNAFLRLEGTYLLIPFDLHSRKNRP